MVKENHHISRNSPFTQPKRSYFSHQPHPPITTNGLCLQLSHIRKARIRIISHFRGGTFYCENWILSFCFAAIVADPEVVTDIVTVSAGDRCLHGADLGAEAALRVEVTAALPNDGMVDDLVVCTASCSLVSMECLLLHFCCT